MATMRETNEEETTRRRLRGDYEEETTRRRRSASSSNHLPASSRKCIPRMGVRRRRERVAKARDKKK
jgi:hypothetical protein